MGCEIELRQNSASNAIDEFEKKRTVLIKNLSSMDIEKMTSAQALLLSAHIKVFDEIIGYFSS